MILIIDHIHHLMNESKMLIFVYNSDWMVYYAGAVNPSLFTSPHLKYVSHNH